MRLRLTVIFVACIFAVVASAGDTEKLKWEPKLNGVFAPWTYVLHEIDGALGD